MKIFQVHERFAFSDMPRADDVPLLANTDLLITLSKQRPVAAVVEAVPDFRYCHMPDGKNIPVEQIEHVTALVVRAVRAGKTVLVHCYGGRNRSGVVAARVLMELNGWSGREALRHIDEKSQKRNGAPRALTNAYYRAWLEALA